MLLVVALYAIPSVLALQPVIDWDIWWHLRTGQWIVENGQIPTTDPFSAYGQGKPWIVYSWLFEVLVYELHQHFGLLGLLGFRVGMTLAIVAAIHRLVSRREPSFVLATGLVGLAALGIAALFQERSWLFSILFYTLTLDVVLDLRAGTPNRLTWMLPVVFALWANLHIQFVNGLFLLGLACAAPLGDTVVGRGQPGNAAASAGSRGWWLLVGLSFACLLATLATPFHVRLYQAVLELPSQTAMFNLVSELQALSFRGGWEWIVLTLTCLAVFTLGRRPRLDAFEILLLATSIYFSFKAQRDCWLVVLAACAILVTGRRAAPEWPQRFQLTAAQALFVVVAVSGVLVVFWVKRDLTEAHLEVEVADKYPDKAAAFVERRALAGPLYNHYNWGGYLMWRLPQYPVAMDGRTIVHGEERIQRAVDTWEGKPRWADDPELNAAGLVIAQTDAALTSLLRLDRRFELVYQDEIAVVFVRAANQSQGP